MRFIADLHVHSKYARATGKDLDLQNLEKFAKIKGVDILGTGDFTHPKWIKEIESSLVEDSSGILRSTTGFPFILQTEISLAYTQGGKGRRVHHLVFAPSIDIAKQITEYLLKKGRVDYDGRPIFGISSIDFTESIMSISKRCMIVPAHVWTPYFGAMGSKSGFDSIQECFMDTAKYIHAIETGLSSDPPMNWRMSKMDKYALLSFSDLHSMWPWRMGREATIFDTSMNYDVILNSIKDKEGLIGTIEVDPAYGKYHLDGHRACGTVFEPEQSRKLKKICPECRRELTIGVLHRVEELADRPGGFKPENAKEFHKLIPLSEIISQIHGFPIASVKTWKIFNDLIEKFKTEFNILLNAPIEEIEKITDSKLASALLLNRQGSLRIIPGYDGEYGRPIFDDSVEKPMPKPKKVKKSPQKGLSDFI